MSGSLLLLLSIAIPSICLLVFSVFAVWSVPPKDRAKTVRALVPAWRLRR